MFFLSLNRHFNIYYGISSKISNTSCLAKGHGQTVQPDQIRVFPVCYSDKHCVNFSNDNQILAENRSV